MGKFYLIQRGKFRDLKKKDYKGLAGRNGLICLDYMGYTEFEAGTIPSSYIRIMHNRKDYIFKYLNDVKNINGKIMVIFCNKKYADQIEEAMKNYLKSPYHCKTFTRLPDQLNDKSASQLNDFWWNVENIDIYSDWMCWFGMDKLTPFKNMLDNDYNEWWMSKSEEERKEFYKNALNSTF